MEFKKIDDKKFQCLLFEEDLEENNISLDDFFRNDTEKIHALMSIYKKVYRYVFLFVLVVGLALAPFLRYIITVLKKYFKSIPHHLKAFSYSYPVL